MCDNVTKEILYAFQKGEHKAFEVVFLAYYNKVKNFIRGFIKSESETEELTQELFVNLWYNHAVIDPEKSFNSYLHMIAHNAVIDFLRHRLVHQKYINNSSHLEYSPSSEDEMIGKETSLLIDMLVEKMPPQRKQIYILSRHKGLSNAEIATQLNTTKRNVESQLSFALKELRSAVYSLFLLMFLG